MYTATRSRSSSFGNCFNSSIARVRSFWIDAFEAEK
jgi:hypothetical protein